MVIYRPTREENSRDRGSHNPFSGQSCSISVITSDNIGNRRECFRDIMNSLRICNIFSTTSQQVQAPCGEAARNDANPAGVPVIGSANLRSDNRVCHLFHSVVLFPLTLLARSLVHPKHLIDRGVFFFYLDTFYESIRPPC